MPYQFPERRMDKAFQQDRFAEFHRKLRIDGLRRSGKRKFGFADLDVFDFLGWLDLRGRNDAEEVSPGVYEARIGQGHHVAGAVGWIEPQFRVRSFRQRKLIRSIRAASLKR